MDTDGASPNERLLFAAKQDSEELFAEVTGGTGFDINHQDSLGMTALHYAVQTPSPSVLDLLLDFEGTDVDLTNKLEGAAPLHLAVRLSHPQARLAITQGLVDAGADPRTKDKHGRRPIDLVPQDETELRQVLRRAEAELQLDMGDVAEDDDGEPGSGSDDD